MDVRGNMQKFILRKNIFHRPIQGLRYLLQRFQNLQKPLCQANDIRGSIIELITSFAYHGRFGAGWLKILASADLNSVVTTILCFEN